MQNTNPSARAAVRTLIWANGSPAPTPSPPRPSTTKTRSRMITPLGQASSQTKSEPYAATPDACHAAKSLSILDNDVAPKSPSLTRKTRPPAQHITPKALQHRLRSPCQSPRRKPQRAGTTASIPCPSNDLKKRRNSVKTLWTAPPTSRIRPSQSETHSHKCPDSSVGRAAD